MRRLRAGNDSSTGGLDNSVTRGRGLPARPRRLPNSVEDAFQRYTKDSLYSGITRLLKSEKPRIPLEILEIYLDNAGDVGKTSQALFIHRTSLYYRLGKAEKIAGMDLGDGYDRLALHLSLRIARLSGLLSW